MPVVDRLASPGPHYSGEASKDGSDEELTDVDAGEGEIATLARKILEIIHGDAEPSETSKESGAEKGSHKA